MSKRNTPTIHVSSRGKLVGAEEEDLHHVDENNRHHEIRAPIRATARMKPTQGYVHGLASAGLLQASLAEGT